MEPPSPARLYAALAGAVLVVLGIAGFFSDLSWLNFLYAASGAAGLALAGRSSLPFALLAGLLYTGLAIVDFSDRGWLHLAIGVLGLAAVAGTSRPQRRQRRRVPKRRLKPRAKVAESP